MANLPSEITYRDLQVRIQQLQCCLGKKAIALNNSIILGSDCKEKLLELQYAFNLLKVIKQYNTNLVLVPEITETIPGQSWVWNWVSVTYTGSNSYIDINLLGNTYSVKLTDSSHFISSTLQNDLSALLPGWGIEAQYAYCAASNYNTNVLVTFAISSPTDNININYAQTDLTVNISSGSAGIVAPITNNSHLAVCYANYIPGFFAQVNIIQPELVYENQEKANCITIEQADTIFQYLQDYCNICFKDYGDYDGLPFNNTYGTWYPSKSLSNNPLQVNWAQTNPLALDFITNKNIFGYIEEGTNISLTGSGTLADPFVINNVGGAGSQDLQSVTDIGNTTTNNIQLIDAAETIYGAGGGILLDNSSRLREGTINAGLGGNKGIAQICGVGYELKWEAGILYVMGSSGNTIRQSLFNFATTPTTADDSTKGYANGSLWTLDNGDVYECTDAAAGTWVLKNTGNSPITIENTTSLFSTGITTYTSTTAENSLFLGIEAGQGVTAQKQISLGFNAGKQATQAYNSNFIGVSAGENASNAHKSNFIGHRAGINGTYAAYSNFIGRYVGTDATNASYSNFIGHQAGYRSTDAYNSIFIGNDAGFISVKANNSIFIGNRSGNNDSVDNSTVITDTSILIGDDTSTGGYSNSIAIGKNAVNTNSNQFTVGDSYTNWSISGINYLMPSTGAGGVLTNDGSNNLSWANVDLSGYVPYTGAAGNVDLGTYGITTNSITLPGVTSQYVRGDGTLSNFPAQGGSGGGTVYYLNGNTSQGLIPLVTGVTMYQLNKAAATGTAANFTKTGTGLLASFITDSGDPNQLLIPAGRWLFECYLSETGGGSSHAEVTASISKYNGTTLTTIATGVAEQITNNSTKDLYTFSVTIPSGTTLTLTDRIVIQLTVSNNANSKTVTLYTEDSSVSSVTTTFANGISSLNGLTVSAQTFATPGTTGTAPSWSSSTSIHTLNIPLANATGVTAGLISKAQYDSFLTANQSITLTGDVTGSGATSISTAIGNNKVTNAMLAQVATATFKGRTTASTGNVEDLTATQATALLDTFTSTLKGLTPSSGGGTTNFLRADGSWAAPAGGGGSMTYPSGSGIAVVSSGTSWGTTLTAPSGTIVGTTDTQTLTNKTIVKALNPQASSYTLVLTDASKVIQMGAAGANSLIIPASGSVNFAVGTEITIIQTGAGQTTISGPSVTLNSMGGWLKIAAQYGAVTLLKVSTAPDEWYVFGALTP